MPNKNVTVASPEMMNSIRNEASQAYQNSVPVATALNLADVGNPILNYEATRNEFLTALVNKIALQIIEWRLWQNPLSQLKRGEMPLGTDIEELHANPVAGKAYDGGETGMAELLKMHKPDVVTEYFRLNRQEKYPVTINIDQLRGAFTSWNRLNNLVEYIIDCVYNGATIDDFKYTKQLIIDAMNANAIITKSVPVVTNEATGKRFLSIVRATSLQMTFPSSSFNSYKLRGGTGPDRISFAPVSDQIILLGGDVAANVSVEALSSMFNIPYGDYNAAQIVVDNFLPTDIQAVVADKRAFIIYNQMKEMTSFFNGSSLSWQYFYHVWDVFGLSSFRNCVALVGE